MCARKVYYIFSNVDDPTAFCAVRQDQPIPSFLDGLRWQFARTIQVPLDKPLGFDLDDAESATRRGSIYFFHREFTFVAGWRELEAA
ncbi:hypothetical protein [Methylobacterium sp. NEAU K]|uniref:hypothetical protein n=1 Tax=Methylobacterium sp. NEAU K TaxID=3064946 RepID=UPI0027369228|nr:hypothetical protein [Methylobacterium sp. NEAU K]MDP4005344.1 hypothetical protein [Methylobacterium sp. NEAU K]